MTYPPQENAYGQPAYGQPAYTPAPTLASWGHRVGSALIDYAPVALIQLVGQLVDGPSVNLQTGVQTGGGIVYNLCRLLALAFLIYNSFYLAGKTGQSLGKKALGLKLVGEASGQPIGMGMAFVRYLAHIIDAVICFIGFLFPLWDAKKQTIADKLVKTLVVK
jgi:uncharacterized RDD family membrane protein YckC